MKQLQRNKVGIGLVGKVALSALSACASTDRFDNYEPALDMKSNGDMVVQKPAEPKVNCFQEYMVVTPKLGETKKVDTGMYNLDVKVTLNNFPDLNTANVTWFTVDSERKMDVLWGFNTPLSGGNGRYAFDIWVLQIAPPEIDKGTGRVHFSIMCFDLTPPLE